MQRAKESHDLAATAAYDGLSSGDDLEDAYFSKASLVVQNQLLRAGRRLAKVLDENFDDQWRCSGAIQRGVDAQNCTIRETASLMGTRSREGGCHEERDALLGDIVIGSLEPPNRGMEMNMRTIVFTVLAAAAFMAASPRKGDAQYAYPWCAQFTDGSGVFSCAFVTFGQCLATVSGIGGFCVRNPAYTFVLPTNELRRVPTHRRSARR